MNNRKIITIGKPSIEKLTKTESRVFYSSLLACVMEYYKDKENKATTKKG